MKQPCLQLSTFFETSEGFFNFALCLHSTVLNTEPKTQKQEYPNLGFLA